MLSQLLVGKVIAESNAKLMNDKVSLIAILFLN